MSILNRYAKLHGSFLLALGMLASACQSEPIKEAPVVEAVENPLGVTGGSVPVPINPDAVDPETGAPLKGYYAWDGTFAELLAADALMTCRAAVLNAKPEYLGSQPDYTGLYVPLPSSHGFEQELDAKMDAALGVSGGGTPSCAGVSALECSGSTPCENDWRARAWIALRSDATCNVTPGTTQAASLVAEVPADLSGYAPVTPAAADSSSFPYIKRAYIDYCVAERLHDVANSNLVANASSDNLIQLSLLVRDRALRATTFLSWYLKNLPKAEATGPAALVDTSKLWAERSGASPGELAQLGQDYLGAISLVVESTEEVVDALARLPEGQAGFGTRDAAGNVSGPRAQAYALIVGAAPDLPPKHGLADIKARQFLSMAAVQDLLRLPLAVVGADYLLDLDQVAEDIYSNLEGRLQEAECEAVDCISATPTVLATRYGFTVEHSKAAITSLAELALAGGIEGTVSAGAATHAAYRYAIADDPLAGVMRRLQGQHRIEGLEDGSASGPVVLHIAPNFKPAFSTAGPSLEAPRPVLPGSGGFELDLFVDVADGPHNIPWYNLHDWPVADPVFGAVPTTSVASSLVLADAFQALKVLQRSTHSTLRGLLFGTSAGVGGDVRGLDYLRLQLGERFFLSSGTTLQYFGTADDQELVFAASKTFEPELPNGTAPVTCTLTNGEGSCDTRFDQPLSSPPQLGLGWWWGLGDGAGAMAGGLHFSHVAGALDANNTGLASASGLTLTGGALFDRAARLMAYRGDDWSKPAYDGLGMRTGHPPVGSALLYGGSAGEPAYSYFLNAAEKASEQAASATTQAFDNLQVQARDESEHARSEEQAAGLGALELEGLCGGAGPEGCEVEISDVELLINVWPCQNGAGVCDRLESQLLEVVGGQDWVPSSSPVAEYVEQRRSGSVAAFNTIYGASQLGRALRAEASTFDGLQQSLSNAVEGIQLFDAQMRERIRAFAASAREKTARQAELDAIETELSAAIESKRAEGDVLAAQAYGLQTQGWAARHRASVAFSDYAALGDKKLRACSDDTMRGAVFAGKSFSIGDIVGGVVGAGIQTGDQNNYVFWDKAYVEGGGLALRFTMESVSEDAPWNYKKAQSFSAGPFFAQAKECTEVTAMVERKRPQLVSQWFAETASADKLDEQALAVMAQAQTIDRAKAPIWAGTFPPTVVDGLEKRLGSIASARLAAVARYQAAQEAMNVGFLTAQREFHAQLVLVGAAYRAYLAARADVFHIVEQGRLVGSRLRLTTDLAREAQQTRFALARAYQSHDLWRAKALSDNARRLAVTARRAIEGHFVVDMDGLKTDEPFVAAPSRWVNDVYADAFQPPTVVGQSSGNASNSSSSNGGANDLLQGGNGAVYTHAIADHVANLRLFVQGYAVKRPTVVAERDAEVMQIPGPMVNKTVLAGGSTTYNVADGESFGWSFFCRGSRSWVGAPVQEFDGPQRSIDNLCTDGRPTHAKFGFMVDPWGRVDGYMDDVPFDLRHNVRWRRLAVNLVGAGIRDCSRALDAEACYAEPFIKYDLRHVGPAWVTDHAGDWNYLPLAQANIEGAKALASEEWVDPVSRGFATSEINAISRVEFTGRPMGGAYEMVIELSGDIRLERIERIQLLAEMDYWVRQGETPDPDPGEGAICGDGILDVEAGELCERPTDGKILYASSLAPASASEVCPTSCDDQDPSTFDELIGDPLLCTAQCAPPQPIVDCHLATDGWCPAGCFPNTDGDCLAGPLVSWSGQATANGAPGAYIWEPASSELVGNVDLLTEEVSPWQAGDAPVVTLNGRTFVQVEGERTQYVVATDVASWQAQAGSGPAPLVDAEGVTSLLGIPAPSVTFTNAAGGLLEASLAGLPSGPLTASAFYGVLNADAGWRMCLAATCDDVQVGTTSLGWQRADMTLSAGATGAQTLSLQGLSAVTAGTDSFAFDMIQVEEGSFPSSPIPSDGTAAVTRPAFDLVLAAADVAKIDQQGGSWSVVLIPAFSSADALDGGASEAYVLDFQGAGGEGFAFALAPGGAADSGALKVITHASGGAATELASIELGGWQRHEAIEVVLTRATGTVYDEAIEEIVATDTLLVNRVNGGGLPVSAAVSVPAIDTNWDLFIGKGRTPDQHFFGLVSEVRAVAAASGDGTVELSADQLCGNGQFESDQELCDDSAGWAHTCPLAWDCDDGNTCTTDTVVDGALSGATACRTHCSNAVVDVCDLTPDGCCPAGCNETTDGDCHTPLASWSDVTFTNLSLGERQIWDTDTHHMFGPFGPGTPALVQLVGRRYVQVEGTRTNLISENRDPSVWFTNGWECADCGPALAPTPYGGLGNTELRGTALQPILGDESGVTAQEILSGTVLEYLVPSQTRTGFVVTCGLRDINPGVDGFTEVFPPDQDQYGSANMGSWRRREGEVSDCSVWPAGSVGADDVDYSGMTLVAMHPRSAPLSAADEGGGRIADFLQLEAGAFPSSPIDSASGQTRFADHVLVRAPDVSPLLREGRWAISVIPEHSSADLIVHAQNATILTFSDSSDPHILALSIALLPDGTLRVLDEETGVELIRTAPLTWSRHAPLELVFDPLAGAVTLSGFDSGNGYVAGSPWAVRSDTDLYVGTLVDTDHFFGLISEPWQVPYAQGDAPYCGDSIVEADETCDGDCNVGVCTANPGADCACDDQNACTVGDNHVSGTAAACDLVCDYPITITSCIDGDGCCPAGCNGSSDFDCEAPKLIFGNRLMSWHRADLGVELDPITGDVLSWADQSPRGNDLSALTSSAYAGSPGLVTSGTGMFNGQPFLEFKHDERDVLSDLAPDWPGLDEPQIYAVMRLTNTTLADTTGRYFLWRLWTIDSSNTSDSTSFYTMVDSEYGMMGQFYRPGDPHISYDDGYGSHFGQHDAWQLMTVGLSDQYAQMRLGDGSISPQRGPFIPTFEYPGVPKGKFVLGAAGEHGNWGGAEVSSAADVNIAELMILEGRPTPAEESELRAYLNSRYGSQW